MHWIGICRLYKVDLIVDGISFRRLPTNAQDANKGKKKQTRESSESSWQCGTCTLINYKPLANICEACESPRSHAASNPTPSSASAMETMPVETLKQVLFGVAWSSTNHHGIAWYSI